MALNCSLVSADLLQYTSREVTVKLHKDKLLKKVTEKGYSWRSQKIPIKVNSIKKAVVVQTTLHPAMSVGDAEMAVLKVTAEVKPRLVKDSGGQNCWVVVKTRITNQPIDYHCTTQSGIKDNEGMKPFFHNLVRCEDVRMCSDRHVNVVLSAIFVTYVPCPYFTSPYIFPKYEGDYCMIKGISERSAALEESSIDNSFLQILDKECNTD